MRIGFWGAGAMGSGLCRNLLRNGHEVLVYSRSKERAGEIALAGRGTVCASFADLADCELLMTCVSRPVYLREGLMGSGEKGLYALMKKGTTHIECSTIDPGSARTLSDAAGASGIHYLQATLGKTPAMAEKALEPIFLGGETADKSRFLPLLGTIGKPVDVGSIEASCAAKLLSNLIGMTNLCVLAEGFRAGEALGLDPHVLLGILRDTGAASFQMDVRGDMLADDSYDDVKFRLTLALKDMVLGTDMAKEAALSVPLFDVAKKAFEGALDKGLGELDCAAVGRRR
ncbi:MAG: NAD(P)-dependent oxidoreductase [Desulfovibrio sp.]|nr:NAD(P)-dependent oxidoreductase [Desulfovibrio sp.]